MRPFRLFFEWGKIHKNPFFYFTRERQRQAKKWQQQRQNYRPMQIKPREASVTVKPDWIVIEEIEKTQLGKMNLPKLADPVDL